MPLHKLEDFDPNYGETFGEDDIKTLHLYTESGVNVGAVNNVLVDDEGRFRYLVIETNIEPNFEKKILLPIGLARINYPAKSVYVDGLSKQQVEQLPEYHENIVVDHDYEEQVRSVYRSPSGAVNYHPETYTYEQEPHLYGLHEQYHQTVKLYEERLITNKHRVKTGEVAVGKHIETETARVTVPIQKERVVIERIQPTGTETLVDANEIHFQAGEVARIEVYEETPEIHKEAFVREEVRVRKVVDRDMVEAQDTIRREELDVDTSGTLNLQEDGDKVHENA